jgi:Subtilase family
VSTRRTPGHGRRTADALADAQRAVTAFPPGAGGTTEPPGITVRWRRSPRCIARCAAGGEDHAHKTDLAMVTHVAGTIAAAANGFGISGVAPNVMPANIRAGQDSGYFFLQPVVDALTYAGVAGIDVVNMSFYVDP